MSNATPPTSIVYLEAGTTLQPAAKLLLKLVGNSCYEM